MPLLMRRRRQPGSSPQQQQQRLTDTTRWRRRRKAYASSIRTHSVCPIFCARCAGVSPNCGEKGVRTEGRTPALSALVASGAGGGARHSWVVGDNHRLDAAAIQQKDGGGRGSCAAQLARWESGVGAGAASIAALALVVTRRFAPASTRTRTHSKKPFSMAECRGCILSWFTDSMAAPPMMSAFRQSAWPWSAARCSGEYPNCVERQSATGRSVRRAPSVRAERRQARARSRRERWHGRAREQPHNRLCFLLDASEEERLHAVDVALLDSVVERGPGVLRGGRGGRVAASAPAGAGRAAVCEPRE